MAAELTLQESIARARSPDHVLLVDKDGQVAGYAPMSSAEDARNKGYRAATRAEQEGFLKGKKYGGTAGELKAFGAGAARGATFGLSDVVGTATGAVGKRTLKGLQDVNPVASTVGEVAGVTTSFLLPGGQAAGIAKAAKGGSAALKLARAATSLPRGVGRIGAGVERAVASKMAAKGSGLAGEILAKTASTAVGGAVEGAAYGVGELVSEQALGETELTASRVISHIGMGALLGAGGAGILGGTSVLAKKGAAIAGESLKKAAPSAKKFFRDMADKSAGRALGARKAHYNRTRGPEKVQAAGREVIDYRYAGTIPGTKARAGEGINFNGAKPSEMVDDIKLALDETGDALGSITSKLDDITKKSGEGIGHRGQELVDRIKKAVGYDAETGIGSIIASDVTAMRAVENQALNAVEEMATRPGGFGFEDLTNLRRRIDKAAYRTRKAGGIVGDPSSLTIEHQRTIRTEINRFIREHADTAAAANDPALIGQLEKVNNQYSHLREAANIAEDRAAAEASNAPFSLTSQHAGVGAGVMVGGVAGLATAAATGAATQLAKSRGWSVVATMADRASKLRLLDDVTKGTMARVTKAIDGFLAGGRTPVGQAAQASAVVAGLNAFDGLGEDKAPKAKRQRLIDIGERLVQITEDPARSIDRISNYLTDVADVAPNIASAMATKTVQAASVITRAVPKRPAPVGPLAIPRKHAPSDQALSRLERVLEVANDPLSVLDKLSSRNLSPDAVKVLKELYPEVHQQITLEIAEKAAALSENLPYADRVQLSILFGVPVDPTMTPDFIAAMQQSFAGPDEQQQAEEAEHVAAGGKPIRLGVLDKLDKSESMRTRTQELSKS